MRAMPMFGREVFLEHLPGYSGGRAWQDVRAALDLRKVERTQQRSNRGGWHSRSLLMHCPETIAVTRDRVAAVAAEAAGQPLRMTDCWINVSDEGHWNVPHHHAPDDFAACVYIQPALLGGEFYFVSQAVEPGAPTNAALEPDTGLVLVFPAAMLHMVAPHRSAFPRISMAMNFRRIPDAA